LSPTGDHTKAVGPVVPASGVVAAATGGATAPSVEASGPGCCGSARKRNPCAVLDDIVAVEEFSIESEALRQWRAARKGGNSGSQAPNYDQHSSVAVAATAPSRTVATAIYDASEDNSLHQRNVRGTMAADSLPSVKPQAMAPTQPSSAGSNDGKQLGGTPKAGMYAFYRAGNATPPAATADGSPVVSTAKPSIVSVSPAEKENISGRRGQSATKKKRSKGAKRPSSHIFDVSKPQEELWHPRPQWRSNDVVDTCPQVLGDLYLGPYIISIRPTGFWYRHVDHVLILLLSAISNFWPNPTTNGEVIGKTIAQVSISLAFFWWVATRDPFTSGLRYKYWVKLYSLLLVAFVAITSGVSYGSALEASSAESQAATAMAVVSFIGTIVLMVMLAVAFIISVFRPDTAEETASDALQAEVDPLATPHPVAAWHAVARQTVSDDVDAEEVEDNPGRAPGHDETARTEAVVMIPPSVSASPAQLDTYADEAASGKQL
jgi:hypothetical protein